MPKFYRIWDIIGDRRRGIEARIPISRASWYLGIKNGIYPAPLKLSSRTSVWSEEDIAALCEKIVRGEEKE